jgi:hypothetical protein
LRSELADISLRRICCTPGHLLLPGSSQLGILRRPAGLSPGPWFRNR